MKTSELLQAARHLITPNENWCKNRLTKTNPNGTMAYCSLGALDHVLTENVVLNGAVSNVFAEAFKLLNKSIPENVPYCGDIPIEDIVDLNDCSSHEDVLATFDRAIAQAKVEEEMAVAQEQRLDAQVEEFIKDVLLVKPTELEPA